MSWLFGALQKHNVSSINFKIDEDCQKIELDNLHLFVGGNSNTSHLQHNADSIFAYVGVLLKKNNDKISILNNLVDVKFPLNDENEYNGHYVIVSYTKGILKIRNDTFGLRELYYYQTATHFFFSTRLDLLIPYTSDSSINFNSFGSLWLTNFQLSNNSIFNNISRLGPSGKILCAQENISISNNKFIKSEINNSKLEIQKELSSFCQPEGLNNKPISLALSGGIDSRLIMTELMKLGNSFKCHSLINEEDKDLEIAKKLCGKFNTEHTLINRETVNLESIENKVLSLYKHILPAVPITQLLDFVLYGNNYLSDKLILDGGFGGFYRRQYLNKIYLKGPSFFKFENNTKLEALLFAPKPSIFNDEINSLMSTGLNLDVNNLTQSFKNPQNKEELAEILDLISIHFMLPAIYCSGQISLDQNYLSYMPLVQENLINLGLNIPLKDKKDSIFIKGLIKNSNLGLENINLVNNNVEYPYWLNYKIAMLNLMIQRKLFKRNNYTRYNVYVNSKDNIYDILQSNDFRNNQSLNHSAIKSQVEQFYKGYYSNGAFLDWFLTYYYWTKVNGITI